MMVEVLKCKECGCIWVIEIKKLWAANSCINCESTNIEIFNVDEDEEIM